MATYAIGDIHGCFDELEALLKLINFNPQKDRLWFVGDLVNRGKHSLKVLRFIYSLGEAATVVLGNHDLYLLSLEYRPHLIKKFPELEEIFAAPDCQKLLSWLQTKSLLHYDENLGYLMVHAGLLPDWDLAKALALAKEVADVMGGLKQKDFFQHMEGNKPDLWQEDLQGFDRWRFIVNCFTRMRFCDKNGRLNLTCKAKIGEQPPNYFPWFKIANRKSKNLKIIFGHWAALKATVDEPLLYPIDTGCVWGGSLSALRLEDEKIFSVKNLVENVQ
jgi:bis(5'-nucleosyl)-tetraphosphatase (symmetrical)